jgi:peptidoglycan hydrolase-like protein with peptidoglycan-binding domain
MFSDDVAHALVRAAESNGIDPCGLLAIVEVETGGKMFEADGRTPSLLFERHVCYREAEKVSLKLRQQFERAGLAIPRWNKATQYKDEGKSAQRLDLIARARAIDEEIANRSASWGLGQTMGFLCHDLGFDTATEMVAHMTGSMDGQIDCMVREIKRSHLVEPLNDHDWKHVAKTYNGSSYSENRYDQKLAAAYARWSRKVGLIAPGGTPRAKPPEQLLSKDEIEQIQARLRDLGYPEVGDPDGIWGSRTVGAISAFQSHEGLPVTGHYDAATKAALNAAAPRPVSLTRSETTADDLREEGSKTIAAADNVSILGKAKLALGISGLGGAAAEQTGLLDTAQTAVDKANQAKGLLGQTHDLMRPILDNPAFLLIGLALVVIGLLTLIAAELVRKRRVEDHRSGVHSGV